MNCSNCGASMPNGAMFCTNCGADMARSGPVQQPRVPRPGSGSGTPCPSCGSTVPEGYGFCPNCGSQVGGMRSTVPSSICWSCSASVPGDMRFCPSCGADQDDIPTRGRGRAVPARSSGGGNGALIALICVLVAIIASLSIAFATGALDGLFRPGDDEDDQQAAEPTPTVAVADPQEQAAAPETQQTPDLSADYMFPDSSYRALTTADLSGLTHQQLGIARNEIFARHGYIFAESGYRAYFTSKSWYVGTTKNPVLSTLETQNVELIRSYEISHFGDVYHWY